MKRIKLFIHLLLIAVLLFAIVIACDKTDNLGGDVQSEGELKDADGNVYNTIKIGSQVWMDENLRTTKYNDNTEMKNVTDGEQWSNLTIGAFCNYDNLESNATTYGRLYNGYAVKTGKLAPIGWHVPTDEDWTILEKYLIANGYNYDGSKDDNKIAKSLCSKTGWAFYSRTGTPGTNPRGNNSTGFTALPGGYRFYDGVFKHIGNIGYWWSSTEYYTDYFYNRGLYYDQSNLLGNFYFEGCGFSVRLVRD
jgi:uncharacterized protein (TIGR02145 family)